MKFSKLYLLFCMCLPFLVDAVGPLGSLQPVAGSPFAAGTNPNWVAFSPVVLGNLFASVANFGSASVSAYLVDQITGMFTPVAGSPFAAGNETSMVAYSPVTLTGNLFAAAPNTIVNNASVYSVDQTTGVFTPVLGSPFATGSRPFSLVYSPITGTSNLFAAVVNFTDNTVLAYTVDQTTGMLSPIIPAVATGAGPGFINFSPIVAGGLFAAISNFNDNTVSVYSVDQTSGVFTEIVGSPFATGTNPSGITYSPVVTGGLFASIVNSGDSTVSVFSVDQTTGFFTPVAGSPYVTGSNPNGVAYSPLAFGSLFLATANFVDGTASVYSVDQTTGALTEIVGSPFATGSGSDGIAYSPIVNGNLFAAVSNFNDNDVAVFQAVVGCLAASVSISANLPVICSGGSTVLSANVTGTPPFTVIWSDLVTQVSSSSPITRTVSLINPTTFTATVTDSLGCTFVSNAITVRVAVDCPFCS